MPTNCTIVHSVCTTVMANVVIEKYLLDPSSGCCIGNNILFYCNHSLIVFSKHITTLILHTFKLSSLHFLYCYFKNEITSYSISKLWNFTNRK